MTLPSGMYIIRNGRHTVGRNHTEDASLLPKGVVLLPEGIQTPKWVVDNRGDGYILKADGDPTAPIDKLLFALLMEQERAEKWKVQHVPQLGLRSYIILTHDEREGWIAPEEPNEQIQCRPLIVMPTDPPQYPPNEVFEFIRIDRDE
ncbi:hypothetical protein AX16_009269 [Volvariella volvacea WC 439]|nr:hypothetical protein AX16_009269 [Volvariella volvacea WC 439]